MGCTVPYSTGSVCVFCPPTWPTLPASTLRQPRTYPLQQVQSYSDCGYEYSTIGKQPDGDPRNFSAAGEDPSDSPRSRPPAHITKQPESIILSRCRRWCHDVPTGRRARPGPCSTCSSEPTPGTATLSEAAAGRRRQPLHLGRCGLRLRMPSSMRPATSASFEAWGGRIAGVPV